MLSPELYERTATFAAFNHMQAVVENANLQAQLQARVQQLQAAAKTIQANETDMNAMRAEIAALKAEVVARRVNAEWVGKDYVPPAPAPEAVADSAGGTTD